MSVICLILVGFDRIFAYSLCHKVGFFVNLTIAISRNEDVNMCRMRVGLGDFLKVLSTNPNHCDSVKNVWFFR